MRVLLHNTETNLYYAGGTQWTAEPRLALDFETTELAIQAFKAHRLNFAEIIVDYGPSPAHKPVPLPDEKKHLASRPA